MLVELSGITIASSGPIPVMWDIFACYDLLASALMNL